MVAAIRLSSTSLKSPSLQSTYRSPTTGRTSHESTMTRASMPSARVRMLRCGMDRGLVAREPALALEGGDEAVVVGDLLELAVLEQVGARVADVDDGQALVAVDVDERHRAQRRAHAGQVGVVASPPPTTASLARCTARTSSSVVGFVVPRAEVLPQRAGRQLRRDLAAAVAAHAVGHDEQAVRDEERVLVVLAHPADVGGRAPRRGGSRQLHHGVADLEAIAACAPASARRPCGG